MIHVHATIACVHMYDADVLAARAGTAALGAGSGRGRPTVIGATKTASEIAGTSAIGRRVGDSRRSRWVQPDSTHSTTRVTHYYDSSQNV